jgi:metal-responsive CopG/Arc/MetJ family transcriptional regulator
MPIKGYNVVTIPEEIYEILKRLSAERGMSMSRIASEAIRRFAGEEGDEHSEQNK